MEFIVIVLSMKWNENGCNTEQTWAVGFSYQQNCGYREGKRMKNCKYE